MARRSGGGRAAGREVPKARPPAWNAPRRALLVAAVVLALFADDRQVGKVGDARQMIQTAVAMATTGEIGVARGIQLAAVPREGGDAVTRYGLGMSVAQLPAAALAPSVEKALGPGASQTLFLLAPLALGLLAAAGAGRAARLLGASERGQAIAVVLASLGSPLGSYAISDLSEPLQAAGLAVALFASIESRRAASRALGLRWAALAGLAAGVALLTKSNLLGVAPLSLLPILGAPVVADGASRRARVLAAAAGAAPLAAAWAVLEVVRFGGVFRGYGGETFSYPFLLGAVRLLVGPNKGLFLFFPALFVALLEAVRHFRRPGDGVGREEVLAGRLEVLASLLPLAALLAMAAPWWAWHGVAGWGPRLLVPGLPGAAALAACAVERWSRPRGRLFVGVSIGLNVLPLLQSPVPVAVYESKLAPVEATPERVRRFGGLAGVKSEAGRPVIVGALVVHEVPLASDFVTHAWFLWVRSGRDFPTMARRLDSPPWLSSRPDLRPSPSAASVAGTLASPLSVGFLGRSLLGGRDAARGEVYTQALATQVLRAHQQQKAERGLALATRLFSLRPQPDAAALVAESYRLLGRHETLRAFLDSLPEALRRTPPVYAVIALAARDVGETGAARAYLERAAGLGMPGAAAALARPPSEWPRDFASLVSGEGLDMSTGIPKAGGR